MKRKLFSDCSYCGSNELLFVFTVWYGGVYRRFCTACILNSHPDSFCPICFQVYGDLPPSPQRANCLNCPSISHLSCAGNSIDYKCPCCANPNFSFFEIDGCNGRFSEDMTKQLVAAALIALVSLNKAAALARAEADRAIREATLARRRATKALERVAYLSSEEDFGSKSPAKEYRTNGRTARSLFVEKRIQLENGDLTNTD